MYHSLEAFETDLRDALVNLYNPLYQPPTDLGVMLNCSNPELAAPVQTALVNAIRQLCPDPTVPAEVPARRYYDLLLYRYVENMTQEAAAERMGISPRYLRELQNQAVQALARKLWRGRTRPLEGNAQIEPLGLSFSADRPNEAQPFSQIAQELAALKKSAPNAQVDVQDAVQSAIRLARALPLRAEIMIENDSTSLGLRALIHPTALRQALLRAIEELANAVAPAAICISSEPVASSIVTLRIAAKARLDDHTPDISLIEQIVSCYGGTVRIATEDGGTAILIGLPIEGHAEVVNVLVVDDNDDLVAFYRAYTTGTPYEITHIREGSQLLERVQQERPDIIVLDVMLPDHDMDGWELLANLREHPLTRTIPVIVCSVIRDEGLALALGAKLYVPKPVRRQQFIHALDQAINRAS